MTNRSLFLILSVSVPLLLSAKSEKEAVQPMQSAALTVAVANTILTTGVDVPCGGRLFQDCNKVITNIIRDANNFVSDKLEHEYRHGKTARDVAILPPDTLARSVDMNIEDIAEGADFGTQIWPACAACAGRYAHNVREETYAHGDVSGEQGRYCGPDPIVYVSNSSVSVDLGDIGRGSWVFSQYSGFGITAASVAADEIFNVLQAPSGRSMIPVAPIGVKAAQDLDYFTNKDHGLFAKLEKEFGASIVQEMKQAEINSVKPHWQWDQGISTPGKNNPDHGPLRQLALQLISLRERLVHTATMLVVQKILWDGQEKFLSNVGNWQKFLGPEVMSALSAQVRAQVLRACGTCGKWSSKCIKKVSACYRSKTQVYGVAAIKQHVKATCAKI
ncbi:MAG: hypothetical protein HY843_06125 [Bdellovibrio sp.]|nr:hypothetical protein [Bdellovibrio sp.]